MWALAVRGDGQTLFTGGADGRINVWADSTAAVTEQAQAAAETLLLQQQQLESAVRERKWGKAVELALALEQPQRLRAALSACLQVCGSCDTWARAQIWTSFEPAVYAFPGCTSVLSERSSKNSAFLDGRCFAVRSSLTR